MNDFRIHHVNVLVDDLAPAVRFYRDVLGLEAIATPEQGFPSQFFRLDDHQQLHMNQVDDVRPFRAHFCLVAPDFMAVFRRAKAADAIDLEPWGRIRRLPTGAMQMFVRDPSGNLIEIASVPHAPIDASAFDETLFDPAVGNFTISGGTPLERR